jgi:single-strand DNA-binding protein
MMSSEFRGTGNVGEVAPLKRVTVGDHERQVAQLRVFFDEPRPEGGKTAAGNASAGFWLDVNVWGERLAAEVAQHVRKGARVHVVGRLAEHRWTVTATNEARRALTLNADQLFLSLARVAEVRFRPRRENGSAPA